MARVLNGAGLSPRPTPLGHLMEEHLEWLLVSNYSEDTADHAHYSIGDSCAGPNSAECSTRWK